MDVEVVDLFISNEEPTTALRCLDDQGNELFPRDQLVLATSMVDVLAPELEDVPITGDTLAMNVGHLAFILENAHQRAHVLQHSGGHLMVGRQRQLQDLVTNIRSLYGRPHLVDNFTAIRNGIIGLAPDEFDYVKSVALADGYEPTEEDYVQAEKFSQQSIIEKVKGTSAARLTENTPENLEEFTKVVRSFDALMLLESQSVAAELLDACMAFGSRRDVRSAISISRRLANLATTDQKSMLTKIEDQKDASDAVYHLVTTVFHQCIEPLANETLNEYMQEIAAAGRDLAPENRDVSRILHQVLDGRAFCLSGSSPISVGSAEETSQETPLEPAPSIEAEEKRPDVFSQYVEKFQQIISKLDCRQPTMLAAKEIKRRGLDEARAILVRGKSDEDGGTIIEGRSKQDAQRLISNIEFLRTFISDSSDIEQARTKLDQAIADTSGAVGRITSFFEEASGILDLKCLSSLQSNAPEIHPIDKVVTEIQNEWDAVSWLIWENWPHPDGPKIAQQLRKLIFFTGHDTSGEASSVVTENQAGHAGASESSLAA